MKSQGPLLSTIYKEPTPKQRMKIHAREEKVQATRRWVAGELSDKEHAGVHRRANEVIKGKFLRNTK